ncbi:MAG: exo-alpha-sialidase [Bryobacteraceae bacterium]
MRTTKTILLLGAAYASLTGCGGSAPVTSKETPAAKPAGRFDEQDLFKAGEAGYTRYRIPALVVSAKGTILAFTEARKGKGHDTDEIDIALRRSFDHGKTWDPMRVILDDGTRTMNQPTPVLDRDTGTIWLPFCKDNRQVFVTKSTDDGETWSTPVEITKDVKDPSWKYLGAGPGHGIQLKSGRLLIPAWGDTSPGPATWPQANWGKVQFSYAFYSDDHGKTWKRGKSLDNDLSDECEVVETTDGKVYMNARSRQDKKARMFARSDDGGVTWSKLEVDPNLPEPSCQAGLARYSTGKDRILLTHPSNTTSRTHLTARLSYDEGRTWPVAKVIQEGKAAYSDLAVAHDKTILSLYESGGSASLRLARFDLEWLTDGADRP